MKKSLSLFGALALVFFVACDKDEKTEGGGENQPVNAVAESIDLSEVANFIGNAYGDLYYPETRINDVNGNLHPKYMFDGVVALDYGTDDAGNTTCTQSSYQYWGMLADPREEGGSQPIPEEMLDPETGLATYSGAPIFDFGSEMRLASLVFYPYWAPWQNNGFAARIEIYAYNGEGEIPVTQAETWEKDRAFIVNDRNVGKWENWTLIGTIDRSEELKDMKKADVLAQKPLLASSITFKYDEVPDARYYRFKLYGMSLYHETAATFWYTRWSISELAVERYVVVE